MSEEDGFDHLLSKVGFGRWQLLMISTSLFMTMVLPIHMVGSPLISAPVSFRCFADATSDDGFQPSFERVNSSSSNSSDYYNSICLNHTIPVTVATLEATTNSNSSTRRRTNLPSCPFIKYDSSIFTSTVISEYDLVCERMSLQPYYQMVFNIGGILGSFIGGHIGDRWGRKKAVQIGALGNILAVLGMVFVPSYPFILLMRLLNGCSCIGVLIPTWSLILESTPSNIRSLVGMLGGLPYSVCVIAFAGVSYYIRTWQYLLLVCSSPVTLLLPLSFIVNESPRWLVQNGRAKEATKILERAVKQNKVKLSDNLETIINKIIEAGTKPSQQNENQDDQKSALSEVRAGLNQLWLYIRSPGMRAILLATSLLWFIHCGFYLGITINANNFTRRIIVGMGLFVGGILILLDLLVPVYYSWLKWVLVMGGFLLVAGSFQVNFVYAPELFPTETRTRGFAFVNMIGSLGFICAPLVTDILGQHTWWGSSVVFGCSGILGSLMLIFLPETNHQPLPETLQDVEDRRRAAKNKSKKSGVENEAYQNSE
ncbi:Solute carrier family 22 member 6-A-like 1 [Homarus americanus]|uniref:Solute carrier family 22 member 6-A-like 1 n=1 Tax=Homarus americanus TaxID=6706 RepID=A0A8J5T0J8_HOMAM|nr:Solute carrier family 22 member 6-A-like 1 [Homarus americanus]